MELDISLLPGQLGADKTLVGQTLANEFLLRAGLVKKSRMLWKYFRMVAFLSFFHTVHGDFVFLGSKIPAAMKLKDTYSLEEKEL